MVAYKLAMQKHNDSLRADSKFAPSHWKKVSLCNDVSYWLGANLESALRYEPPYQPHGVAVQSIVMGFACKYYHSW